VTVALERIAARHDVHASTVALAFVMTHPSQPVPILGTQRVERVQAAAAALELRLERTEWYELYQAGTGEPLP
jgi:predicted oxidoreductase